MSRQLTRRQTAILDAMRCLVGTEQVREVLGSDEQAARRMERWDQAGLGPLLRGDADADARHYLAVAAVAGRGTPTERSAVGLARQGVACRHLGDVIRAHNTAQAQAWLRVLDPYGADVDTAEQVGEWLATDGVDPDDDSLMARMFRAIRARAVELPGGTDWNSVAGDMAAASMGGLPIETPALAAAVGLPDCGPVGTDTDPWLVAPTRSRIGDYLAVVEGDLAGVAAMVPFAEWMLRSLLDSLGVSLRGTDDDELGLLSVILAPAQVAAVCRSLPALGSLIADPTMSLATFSRRVVESGEGNAPLAGVGDKLAQAVSLLTDLFTTTTDTPAP